MSAMPAARVTELGSLAAPGAFAAMARVNRTTPPVARRWGRASRVSRTAAISFSSMSDSQVASSIDSSGPAAARPALCTTPSMRPQRATAASANAARSEATDTSARTPSTPPPDRLQSRLCLPQPLLVAAADRHRRALGDQLRGERETEPVAATGDEHDLAAELEIHLIPP